MNTKIYKIKDLCGDRFFIMPHPRGGAALSDEIKNLHTNKIEVVASMLTKEEQTELELLEEESLCERYGIIFLNYPIKDEVADSISKTIEFIDILEGYLSQKNRFLFHCRGGVGRSSMMLSLLAARLGVEPIKSFELISKSRGEKAPESPFQERWIKEILKT